MRVQRPPFFAAFFGAVALASAVSAQTDPIAQARSLVEAERYVEALAVSQEAARANPEDHRAHYYVAMAYLGSRQFDQAAAAAREARTRAPADARPAVDRLIETIASTRSGSGSLQEAEAALADGLVARAAQLYEAAWAAGQNNPDLGLKAAEIYSAQLNQPVDAARVLRQIKATGPVGDVAAKVEAELTRLAPTLRTFAEARVTESYRLQGDAAMAKLAEAEAADPALITIYEQRVRIGFAGPNQAPLEDAIKDLARNLQRSPRGTWLAAQLGAARWFRDPSFVEFLGGVIGPNVVQDVLPERQLRTVGEKLVGNRNRIWAGVNCSRSESITCNDTTHQYITQVSEVNGCVIRFSLGETANANAPARYRHQDLNYTHDTLHRGDNKLYYFLVNGNFQRGFTLAPQPITTEAEQKSSADWILDIDLRLRGWHRDCLDRQARSRS